MRPHGLGEPGLTLLAPAIRQYTIVSFVTRLTVLVVVLAASTGCVQRRLTIRSNPPGALVYVDNYEIGTTPVSTDYIYYGTRQVRLVKDGYETLTVKQKIPAPWYQYPPLDFLTENIWPTEIRDERTLDYQMRPQVIVPSDQLLGRAENLRQGANQELFTPPPRVETPTVTAPPAR